MKGDIPRLTLLKRVAKGTVKIDKRAYEVSEDSG